MSSQMNDLCVCDHESSDHVMRRGSRECTICTCNAFDWVTDAQNEHVGLRREAVSQ